MSVLWVASLLVLAAGTVLIAATLRKMAEATIALRDECGRLDQLHLALVDLRHDADVVRATVARIRSRPDRNPDSR